MKHYKYGGSTAARTLACPSWVNLADTLPKQPRTSSSYAAVGTALHTCMENILNGDVDSPEACLGLSIEADPDYFVTIDEDHVELLNMALDAWDKFCAEYKIKDYELEQTFELTEDIGGTTDVKAWSESTVYIVDWKFGQGMEVEAEKSAQGMFYGICVKHNEPELFLDRDMGVAIIQPMPNEHDHDTCKVWQVPANELRQFRTDYFAAVGYEGDPEYHTGSHCTFCPAAGICPAKTGAAVALLRLTPEQAALVGSNLQLAIDLEKWAGQVKALAHEQLEIGTSIDGFKLVQKRATRKWTDDAAVEVALRKIAKNSRGENNLKVSEVMVAPKLLTPPQIEKVFKKKSLDLSKVGDYIISESSGTTLAVESDKRPAILSRTALKEALQRTT